MSKEISFKKIQEGYYTEDGFTTRYNEWMEEIKPPGMSDEEYENRTYGTIFRTTDGKLFGDRKEANNHQETINIPELNDIAEKIQELIILCESVKEKSPLVISIKDALCKLNGDGGAYMLDKYYDSTCY